VLEPGIIFSDDSKNFASMIKQGTFYELMINGELCDTFLHDPVPNYSFLQDNKTVNAMSIDILKRRIDKISYTLS
ncbi:hypothetical protein ACFL5S_01050, partial [Fibrobacterota bacterium]